MEGASIGFLLKQIHDNMDRHANRNLKPQGLTFSQMRLLVLLYVRPSAPSQKELEEQMGVTHPTVVGLIKRLEGKGLVRCGFDSRDKRVKERLPDRGGQGIYVQSAPASRSDGEQDYGRDVSGGNRALARRTV